MAYLTRRIPLRHGTPQIRKAQIPRSPCGFAWRRERLEARNDEKKSGTERRKGGGGGGEGGETRSTTAGSGEWGVGKRTRVGNEKEKEFQRFRRSRLGGTIWEDYGAGNSEGNSLGTIDTMNIRYFPGCAKYLSKQQFRTLMCRCKDNVCRANMAIPPSSLPPVPRPPAPGPFPTTPQASYLRFSYRTDMINISVLINSGAKLRGPRSRTFG